MKKPIMTCIGSAAQDVFLSGDVFTPKCSAGVCYEHLKLGDKLSVENVTYATGGNAMNAAVTFARQHLHTNFVGLLGDDPAAQIILRELDNESIDTSNVLVNKKYTTSYSTVLLAPNGERTILNYHGEPLSSAPDVVDSRNIEGDWLYVSSVGSMKLLKKIMKIAHDKDVKVAFNPASFELSHIQECADLLTHVSLLALNKEEAQMFVDGKTIQELARNLAESVEYVLVSDGPNGSVATDGKTMVTAGMYDNVPVLDRTGAGDAFTSGFVSQIALGKSIEHAIVFASANSTSVVSKIGAKAGILHGQPKLHEMPLKVKSF